mgnify:CR=1 FL=1
MVRTQIQLTEEQFAVLRSISAARGISMAELIRLTIDQLVLREAKQGRESVVERALSVAGRFASGSTDASTHHDRYLAEAFEGR